MKKSLLVIFLCLLLYDVRAQSPEDFHQVSMQTNLSGMYILGGWAISGILSGAYGWRYATGSNRYFFQMNTMWNFVNLSIAGFALYQIGQTHPSFQSPDQIYADHLRFERLYLINAGLDILYMAAGGIMIRQSQKSLSKADLLKGYGQSIILQGAFLFVFDLAMYIIQADNRHEFAPLLQKISVYPGGLSLSINF